MQQSRNSSSRVHSFLFVFIIVLAAMLPAAEVLPGSDDFLLNRARALTSQGRFSVSALLLRKVLENDPRSGEAYLAMGKMLRDAGYYFLDNELFSKSLETYQKVLDIEPAQPEAMFGKAVLLYESGQFNNAAVIFKKLLASSGTVDSNHVEYFYKASLWYALVKEKGKDTIKAAEGKNRCDLCWSDIGGDLWKLEDGRILCEDCFVQALNDEPTLVSLYAKVLEYASGTLGLKIKKIFTSHLVSSDEMAKLAQKNLQSFEDADLGNMAGLYARYGDEPCIYVLRGLPKFEAIKVMAHEYAHAWVSENCPPDIDLGVNEGFSEWVAYKTLEKFGCSEDAWKMFLDPGPYGVHFKRMEVIARIRGDSGIINLMKEGRF